MSLYQVHPLSSPPRRLTTSFLRYGSPRLQEEKVESLKTQYEYLKLLRLRHLQWMNSADDPEAERVHLQISELLEQIADRYHGLLDELDQ